jgi:hypothetical protein
MVFKQDEVLKAAVFILLGMYGIYWAFTQPCNIAPMTQEYMGQTIEIKNPPELNQMICLTTDWKLVIVTLLASASLFSGASKLISNV